MRIGPVALVTAAVLLTACTSDRTDAAPNPAARETASPRWSITAPTPTGPPIIGGTLRVIAGDGPAYLDPNLGAYSVDYTLLRTFSRQLYAWQALSEGNLRVVPDLATDFPVGDASGTVWTVTIRRGARWDTRPPRQVRAADVVRGVAMTCNPAVQSVNLEEFVDDIVGLRSFCRRFTTVPARREPIRRFLERNSPAGVRVGSNAREVVVELTHPLPSVTELLALPALSPRPAELLAYLPGSIGAARHAVADGPYRVTSFVASVPGLEADADFGPAGRLVLRRNPAWRAANDPLRMAYVNRIVVRFLARARDISHAAIRQLRTRRSDVCLCDIDAADARRLVLRNDTRLTLHHGRQSRYLLFNTISPNNHGALQNPEVRRAIAFALDRTLLVRAYGGDEFAPPLTHVLPDGIPGDEDFDPLPHDTDRAKALLRTAGVHSLTLRVYVRAFVDEEPAVFRIMRRQLRAVGIEVESFYADERWPGALLDPSVARSGEWDLAITGWAAPQWPNSAGAFFRPLFDSRALGDDSLESWSFNAGVYANPEVDRLIDTASQATGPEAAHIWHQADVLVMQDVPIYPIAQPVIATYRSSRAHDNAFVPSLLGADLSNVWLDETPR